MVGAGATPGVTTTEGDGDDDGDGDGDGEGDEEVRSVFWLAVESGAHEAEGDDEALPADGSASGIPALTQPEISLFSATVSVVPMGMLPLLMRAMTAVIFPLTLAYVL